MEGYNGSSDSGSDSNDSALEIMFEGEDLFDDDIDGFANISVRTKMIDTTLSEYSSDSLRSINSDSEEELSTGKKQAQPIFTELKDMKMMQWQPGLIFKSKDHFKDAVITYAIQMGVGLKMMKNDNRRIRFKCKPGCEWEIYAAPMKDKDTWEVQTIIDKHTCSREFNNKLLSAKWLSKRIESKVRDNPSIEINKIVDKVKSMWVAGISRDKAVRAKAKATILVEGNDGDQYNNLNHYCAELLRSNRGSSVLMKFTWPAEHFYETPTTSRTIFPRFQRLYVCLSGCRESFKCCRPFVGLDGCFLKGPYGGQLLTAIGRDPNDQMLPIAYAVVEVENKDSWTWFLSNLIRDIGHFGITYISDQQKGLVQTFKELLPSVDHRFCVRHLYNNFRKKYPSKNLKGLLWRASNATYEEEWVRAMQEINSISHGAYDHLISVDKTLWCKHAFSSLPRCDVVVNNMSEAFNRVILDMRDKPILTMCEDIRLYMMHRWVDIRERVDKQTNDVNPKILKKIEEEAKQSGGWMPLWSNNKVFEVVRLPDKFVVDLDNWYCSCGKWRYLANQWAKFLGDKGDTQILPPIRRRAPGRPKKKRRMEANEEKSKTRISRKFGTVKCSRCGNPGHNKKSCKN